MRLLLTILLTAASLATAAPILTITFTPDTLPASPGDTLHFIGTLTNNTNAEVFVNGETTTFALAGLDDSEFLTNAPISVGALATSTPFEFLLVTIPGATGPGTYDGAITIIGGASDTAQDVLGAAAFHATVGAGVPEPGSFGLTALAAGLFGLALRRVRKA